MNYFIFIVMCLCLTCTWILSRDVRNIYKDIKQAERFSSFGYCYTYIVDIMPFIIVFMSTSILTFGLLKFGWKESNVGIVLMFYSSLIMTLALFSVWGLSIILNGSKKFIKTDVDEDDFNKLYKKTTRLLFYALGYLFLNLIYVLFFN